jgi:hypothetical protein
MDTSSLKYFIFKQLPILPPSAYAEADIEKVRIGQGIFRKALLTY